VRGLKLVGQVNWETCACRTPRGVRGLKSKTEYSVPQVTVAPLAGCVD